MITLELSSKLGGYRNGLEAFLKVFRARFMSESHSSNSMEFFLNQKHVCQVSWLLDEGGMNLFVISPFLNETYPSYPFFKEFLPDRGNYAHHC